MLQIPLQIQNLEQICSFKSAKHILKHYIILYQTIHHNYFLENKPYLGPHETCTTELFRENS